MPVSIPSDQREISGVKIYMYDYTNIWYTYA